MDSEALYERWRQSRSQVETSDRLADRVMESIEAQAPTAEPQGEAWRASRVVRASVCAAAVLAALFRVVELLNLFSANRIEN